jgi:hypothetical protein
VLHLQTRSNFIYLDRCYVYKGGQTLHYRCYIYKHGQIFKSTHTRTDPRSYSLTIKHLRDHYLMSQIMLPFLNRRELAVSILPNFLLTALIFFLNVTTVFSNSLAKAPRYNSLTNGNQFNFNYNYVNNYIQTEGYKSITVTPFSSFLTMEIETNSLQTPPNDNDNEGIYHDTIQRESNSNSNSVTSENLSTTSKINPITLNQPHSPTVPPVVTIQSTMGTMKIGGLTITVESTEQVRTNTGALYTKAIRSTYDTDKKGKLDLLKLVQSKQQQPYVATSISVKDPEKLLNHYSLSKLNKECSRNLNKYDLLSAFRNIVYPIKSGEKELCVDASGDYLTHDLFKNTFQVTAQQVADSSRWYSGFTVPADRFQEDLEWSLAYFENNVDSSLYARIHAKLLTYDERCRGGPLFFKLLNDETTTNSDANKKALIVIVDTYKIRSNCIGEHIPDVVDLFRSVTDTVHALHDDSLPDEYVDNLITIFTTTSVEEFNDLFESLKKQLFASQLQASITSSLIVPSAGTSSLTNNLEGATYVLEYAGKAFYTLSQKGSWDKCLQQVPGESALITPPGDDRPTFDSSKCFNCGGTHHLRFCPLKRDQSTIDKNRALHPSGSSPRHQQGHQPTSFRGGKRTPYVRPTKWRLPEEGENNKRIIDNKPFTFNPSSKRWEPDTTPESGQKAANIVPPTTPSAAQPPVPQPPSPASTPDMKGAFFTGGYGPTNDMDTDTKKQFIALQMKVLQQQWDSA